MPKTRTAIGLDLGSRTVKAVRLSWTRQSLRLEQALAADIPEEAEHDAELKAEWLRDFCKQLKSRGARVTLAVPGSVCNVQLIKFPRASPSQLHRMAALEAQRLAGISGQDVAHDFIMAGEPTDTEAPVLVALCRAATVENDIALAAQAGLVVEEVTLPNLALHNAFNYNPQNPFNGVVAFADIGNESTNIAISHNGVLLFARSFASGGSAFTSAIMQAAALSRVEAENWKLEHGQLFFEGIPEGAKEAALLQAAETWLAEFNETLAHFFEQSAGTYAACDRIVLCGGGSLLRNFPDWLAVRTEKIVESLAPLTLLGADNTAIDDAAKIDPRFAVAAGLALQGLKLAPSLSLLPTPAKERRVIRRHTRQLAVYSAMAAVIFSTLLAAAQIQIHRVNQRLQAQRDNLRRCQEIVHRIENHRNQIQQVVVKLQPVADLANRAHRLLTVWRDITTERRGNDWLTLFADAESYYALKQTGGAQAPALPFGPIQPPNNPLNPTPQPAIIIVEGYTTDQTYKTVEAMVKALNDKSKYPYFKKVDELPADRRIKDDAADAFWPQQARVRRFTLELQMDWTRVPEPRATRQANETTPAGSMAPPIAASPAAAARPLPYPAAVDTPPQQP